MSLHVVVDMSLVFSICYLCRAEGAVSPLAFTSSDRSGAVGCLPVTYTTLELLNGLVCDA